MDMDGLRDRTRKPGLRIVLFTLAAILVAAPSAHAVDKCKVKIDAKSGVISVSATGVIGTLQWGSTAGSENQAFFNPSCVSGDSAKGCQLADPATLASKTPPAGCTIYLDDGTAPCSVWIKGCSPGQRDAPQKGSLVWKDANGVTVGAAGDDGTTLFRDDGAVLSRIALTVGIPFETFARTGALWFTAPGCTGTAYVTGDQGQIRTTVVHDPNGPVWYAQDGGTLTAIGSYLQTGALVMTPIDCAIYFPGSTFVAPHGCCTPAAGSLYLATPVAVDLTGVTFPVHTAIQ